MEDSKPKLIRDIIHAEEGKSDDGFHSIYGSQRIGTSDARSSIEEHDGEDDSMSDEELAEDFEAEESGRGNSARPQERVINWLEGQQTEGNTLEKKIAQQLAETGCIDLSLVPVADVKHAAQAIQHANEVERLVWKNSELKDDSIATIIESVSLVPGNTELLDISYNRDLGEKSARAVANLLAAKDVTRIKAIECGLDKFHDDIILPAMRTMPEKFGTTIEYSTTAVKFQVDEREHQINLSSDDCVLTFPPNSVQHPTDMSFQFKNPTGEFPNGVMPVTPIVRCLPRGTAFRVPVKVKLKTWIRPQDKANPPKLKVMTRKYKKSKWVTHGKATFLGEDSVQFHLRHFSDVAVTRDARDNGRVGVRCCSLIFVPAQDPLIGQSQTVLSWFGPDDEHTKDDAKRRQQRTGARVHGRGEFPLTLRENFTLSDSLEEAQNNQEPVRIMPPHITQIDVNSLLTQDSFRYACYEISLANEGGDADPRIAYLKHSICHNDTPLPDDPVSLKWRREQPNQRPVHNHYYVTTNNCQINQSTIEQINFTAEEQPAEGQEQVPTEQRLLCATVVPAVEENQDESSEDTPGGS